MLLSAWLICCRHDWTTIWFCAGDRVQVQYTREPPGRQRFMARLHMCMRKRDRDEDTETIFKQIRYPSRGLSLHPIDNLWCRRRMVVQFHTNIPRNLNNKQRNKQQIWIIQTQGNTAAGINNFRNDKRNGVIDDGKASKVHLSRIWYSQEWQLTHFVKSIFKGMALSRVELFDSVCSAFGFDTKLELNSVLSHLHKEIQINRTFPVYRTHIPADSLCSSTYLFDHLASC